MNLNVCSLCISNHHAERHPDMTKLEWLKQQLPGHKVALVQWQEMDDCQQLVVFKGYKADNKDGRSALFDFEYNQYDQKQIDWLNK
jgi:hypothetical protein